MKGSVKVTPSAAAFFADRGANIPAGYMSRAEFTARLREAADRERMNKVASRVLPFPQRKLLLVGAPCHLQPYQERVLGIIKGPATHMAVQW